MRSENLVEKLFSDLYFIVQLIMNPIKDNPSGAYFISRSMHIRYWFLLNDLSSDQIGDTKTRSSILIWEAIPLDIMTHVAKIVEIIGSSDKGWEEAAQVALDEAKKTIHGITGLEVTDMTAKVDPSSGMISQYRAAVKISFGIEH
jgi:dodecin